ncbi:hypothetical protein [Actinoplanes couchii]|uniref:Integral membrane protein n=1 Tax=Actinoplanes couchii TaxID=403638 RepID=A0ABQ3X8J7_9ACTN|nr:hypothetical protein [Actinoplanes couchii]MDR6320155.1 hypothetical protein [Actinoplanes couchii]GID54831.1 hypothetical protein Aco03nite_032350 [Actinoplanes couchii]
MTADAIRPGDDPRRILSEVRGLAARVRRDQRLTWVALLVLGAVTLLAVPFDAIFMQLQCQADGCTFARRGMLYYWPPALLIAYATIAWGYLRAARARGVGGRVLPYAITGAVTAVVFTAAYVAAALYFPANPPFEGGPVPFWWIVLDRLIAPWGLIGLALLVLAAVERNGPLLLFTGGYLALVLLVLPTTEGMSMMGANLRLSMAVPQLIIGIVLLAGAFGFAKARRP